MESVVYLLIGIDYPLAYLLGVFYIYLLVIYMVGRLLGQFVGQLLAVLLSKQFVGLVV